MPVGYPSFEIELFDFRKTGKDSDEGFFRVRTPNNPVRGQTHEEATERQITPDLLRAIRRLDSPSLRYDHIVEVGTTLADLLFPQPIRELLHDSLNRVGKDGLLRISLRCEIPALTKLPWEYAYLPLDRSPVSNDESGFLCLNRRVSIIRDEVRAERPFPLGPVGGPVRLVALLADVTNDPDGYYPPLQLGLERSNLEKLRSEVPKLKLDVCPDGTLPSLENALAHDIHIFHFAGHGKFDGVGVGFGGEGTGSVVLTKTDGTADPLPASALALNLANRGIRLAFLGGCETGQVDGVNPWSGVAPSLIKQGIPAVVGMQRKISDAASIAFSHAFYRSLVAGNPIDTAMSAGRLAIFDVVRDLVGRPARDWGVPVLYLSPTAEAVLFPHHETHAIERQEILNYRDRYPYKGLVSFEEGDREFFHGRDTAIGKLVDALKQSPRFVAVLGPSGSGKSSLVRAGLIPELHGGAIPGSDRWEILLIRDATQTVDVLTSAGIMVDQMPLLEALKNHSRRKAEPTRTLLIVDHFERLLLDDGNEHTEQLLDTFPELLKARFAVSLIVVIRDDFYGRLVRRMPRLMEGRPRGLFNAPTSLERRDVAAIVQEPARIAVLRFERGLAERILTDAMEVGRSSMPGASGFETTSLPLLEFALTELWRRRESNTLQHAAYEAIGRVTGGLTHWADQTFDALDENIQPLARQVLMDLIQIGDESGSVPDTPRRRALGYWANEDRDRGEKMQVVEELIEARLLVVSRAQSPHASDTVSIIHDALLRDWGRLKQWIEDDRRFLRWREELEVRLSAWVASHPTNIRQRDDGRLLRGRDLTHAEQWSAERQAQLSDEERQFIRISRDRQNQEHRRLQELLDEREQQRRLGLSRQLAAQAELLRTQRGHLLQRSTLLAVESLHLQPSWEAYQTLRECLRLLPRVSLSVSHPDVVASVAFHPTQALFATGGWDDAARVWDAETGRQLATLSHRGRVWFVSFSPMDDYIATASQDGNAYLWRIGQSEPAKILPHDATVSSLAFSPDGKRIITGSRDRTARIWSLDGGEDALVLPHSGAVLAVAFSHDGLYVATAASDGKAFVWPSGKAVPIFPIEHDAAVTCLAFSPDDHYVATGSADWTARVTSTEGSSASMLFHHRGDVNSLAFSPNGAYLVTGSADRHAMLWNLTLRASVASLEHEGEVAAVTFSPDGRHLATAGADRTARVWEVPSGRELARGTHRRTVWALAFSPDSRKLVSASEDNNVHMWEIPTGNTEPVLQHDGRVHSAAFSFDGKHLVTASRDGLARVWDVTNGNEELRFEHRQPVWAAAFSPDGKSVATACRDRIARVWRLDDVNTPYRFLEHDDEVNFVAYSPSGEWLATASSDTKVRLWNMRNPSEIRFITHARKVLMIAFSPDGDYIATASWDRAIRIWRLSNLEVVDRVIQSSEVLSIAFSADGRLLAVSTTAPVVTVYEVHQDAGQLLVEKRPFRWLDHEEMVISTSFSPKADHLATASTDRSIRVWDLQTGQEVIRLSHRDVATAAIFSPCDDVLASASWDRTARVWHWQPADLVAEARRRVTQNLTYPEWQSYLGFEPYHPTFPDLEAEPPI